MGKETRTDWTIWLKQQQQIVINILSRSILILGLAGLLISLARVINEQTITFNMVYYVVSFVLLLILYYVRRIPDLWRSLGFLLLLYAFGSLSIYTGWLASGGRGFLLAAIVVSAVLINPRVGLYVAGLVLITYVLFGLAFSNGWIDLRPLPDPTTPSPIIIEGIGFAMNILLVAGGLWFFGKALMAADRANRQVQEAYVALDAKTRELEIAKDLIARQAEMALMYSEEKFHNVIAQATDGILISDEQGVITDWNKAAEQITGIPKNKAVGRHYRDLQNMMTTGDRSSETGMNTAQEKTPGFQTGEAPWTNQLLDYQIQRPDGVRRFIQWVTFPIQTEKGYMIGSILRDITDRKLAEQALAFSEMKFNQAFHASPVIMTIENQDGVFVDVNQAFCNAFGYRREEVVGHRPSEFNLWASEEDRQIVRKLNEEGKSLKDMELHIRRRSGEIGTVLISSERFEANGIQYELTSALDITERKLMADKLFEEKELAQVTLHSIGDAVITTGVDSIIEYLNPIAENLTGWKMDEAVGLPLTDVFLVIEEGTRKPATNPVERCLKAGGIVGLPHHSILVSRDGREFSIADTAAPIRNRRQEVTGVVLVFHDVTEERRLSLQVAHDAMHDSLTGLINRREFEHRLERALQSTKERGLSHILCYLDLDQFKIVNDTAGHAAGDELLKRIGGLLSGLFRQRDTFARLGGDEFGLLLENCQLDQALIICNEILARTRSYTFPWEGNRFQVGVSIGVVPITKEKESVSQLLSQADIACYSAKDMGRNRIYIYQSEDSETLQRHGEIIQVARMRDAILNDQFLLYCQPIANLTDDLPGFHHYEMLLRMLNDNQQLILPGAFIPSAERYGLMTSIDRWVIRQTFSSMSKHDIEGMQISINLSGNSLDDEDLLEYVLEQLREFSILPGQICFEITETAAIHHLDQARKFAQGFRQQGGKIALDDFGSEFSSFRYLKSLPVDQIKIDGSFVTGLLSNPGDQVMVEAITQVAHILGIQVIAEYAADLETINRLREIGVECAQGYGIGHPVPISEAWKGKE